jgi:hypothetical protein
VLAHPLALVRQGGGLRCRRSRDGGSRARAADARARGPPLWRGRKDQLLLLLLLLLQSRRRN